MPPRGNRPTAFSQSFGDDDSADEENVRLTLEPETNRNSLFGSGIESRVRSRNIELSRSGHGNNPSTPSSLSGAGTPFGSASSGSTAVSSGARRPFAGARPPNSTTPTPAHPPAAASSRTVVPERGSQAQSPSQASSSSRPIASGTRSHAAQSASPQKRPTRAGESPAKPAGPSKRKEPDTHRVNEPRNKRHQPIQPALPDLESLFDLGMLDDCIVESVDIVVIGEDEPTPDADAANSKPIRLLTDFIVFDPKHGNRYVSLNDIVASNARHFEAAGLVAPVYANEEDAGQDIAADEDEGVDRLMELQLFRTTAIIAYSIDYADDSSPLVLETTHAHYILKKPSTRYQNWYQRFYRPHRIAQLAISLALTEPANCTRQSFLDRFEGLTDEFLNEKITEEHVQQAHNTIIAAVQTEQYKGARLAQFMKDLSGLPRTVAPVVPPVTRCLKTGLMGNIDLMCLRPSNQNTTTVTPFVDRLAAGLFRERLHVLGPQLSSTACTPKARYQKLCAVLCTAAKFPHVRVEFPKRDCLSGRYWKTVKVNHALYAVGDVVIVPSSSYPGRKQYDIPSDLASIPLDHTIADYFWFGRIIHLDQQLKCAHLHWFEHASKTMLQEIHNPHELFLTSICSDVSVELFYHKIELEHVSGQRRQQAVLKERNPLQFFYSFLYNQADGSFVEPNESPANIGPPPENCPVCNIKATQDQEQHPTLNASKGQLNFGGNIYHINDFALLELLEPDRSVCGIGQITRFLPPTKARELGSCKIVVTLLGRVSDFAHHSDDIVKDERHLFITQEQYTFPATSLLRPCRVIHKDSLHSHAFELYLSSSPYHFFVTNSCQSVDKTSWANRQALSPEELVICATCWKDYEKHQAEINRWAGSLSLPAFDPFAGVGAFGLALQDTGAIKLTHAVEISASAAKTLSHNSPETVVYNQCSNLVLEHAVKKAKRIHPGPLLSLEGKTLPLPPTPRDIECVVAGFPCQPHSALNMYQKADDRKSHLILNLLSWVDFLQPKYCIFENVRGFLQFSLNSTQKNKYSVEGGIAQGGLKFLVNTLLAMGYQVRFALLDAAHYGTPQARVRFFLLASKLGYTLPSFPEPLYASSSRDNLQVNLPYDLKLAPIGDPTGKVPFQFVSIEDAISDLPYFDWRNPEYQEQVPRHNVPLLDVDPKKQTCGFNRPEYSQPPQSRFQQVARSKEHKVKFLQHFTRSLQASTVARVAFIPLIANADYRNLLANPNVPRKLLEWHWANPLSSIARKGFRPGAYGRLGPDTTFKTTTTNISPTAKQGWVLHPHCHRVYTVRELARSQGFPDHFEFCCVTDQWVKTFHREIGNAVPWPVGRAIGHEVFKTLVKDRSERQSNMIEID